MEMPERKMKQYQSKVDELSSHLMAQELAFGLRKRQRTKEAKSVFTKVSTPDQNCTERRRESAPFGWIWPE